MAKAALEERQPNRWLALSLNRPAAVMLGLFLLVVLFKILDSFILRWDEKLGEAILTKGAGLLLVLLFVWRCQRCLGDIGLHRRNLSSALLFGAGVPLTALGLAYGLQIIVFASGSEEMRLTLAAIDPKSGMTGGTLFAVWMIAANLINAGMEEGLFRGLMLRHFRVRFAAWPALLLQAGLFSIWHLSWPIKNLLLGDATWGEAGFEALGLLVATFTAGIVYGYLYLRTNSLWAPFLTHFLNNTILNIVLFDDGANLRVATEFIPFALMLVTGYLITIPLLWFILRNRSLPQVQPWGQFEAAETTASR